MPEKSVERVSSIMFGDQRMGNLLSQILDILGDEVGHFAVCGMSPAMVNHVQLRGISR
jgi:hypothetical protein